MTDGFELTADYLNDPKVDMWEDKIEWVMMSLAAEGDYESKDLNDETGPDMFIIQLSGDNVREYATPMDPNPADEMDEIYIDDDPESIYEFFKESVTEDGAIVIAANGRIMSYNAHLEPSDEAKEKSELAPGMGTKALNGARISAEEEVVYAKTLSGEDGTITTYVDGSLAEQPKERTEYDNKWRNEE